MQRTNAFTRAAVLDKVSKQGSIQAPGVQRVGGAQAAAPPTASFESQVQQAVGGTGRKLLQAGCLFSGQIGAFKLSNFDVRCALRVVRATLLSFADVHRARCCSCALVRSGLRAFVAHVYLRCNLCLV
jgi:hypothetical protein